MATLPTITIITPSYNQGVFIEQTIDSILSQGYPNLEYIVLDGGSTDGTLDVLRKYDDRLVWISEKDRGQSDALNKGFRMATGEVIGFLNSDDYYEPGALMQVGRFFAERPDAAWVTGKCRTVDPHGREIRKLITLYKQIWLRLRSYRVLLVLNYISQPATIWRRSVWEAVGGLDERLHYAMEYDYWLRIGQQFKLDVLDEDLACFRVHPASKAGSSERNQFQSELAIAERYIRSPFLLDLHNLHVALVVAVYKQLLARERTRSRPAVGASRSIEST